MFVLTTITATATAVTVQAAPAVPAVTPPGVDKILTPAGWVIFGIGVALVLAFGWGLVQVAWASHHQSQGPAAMGLAVKALCGAAFGILGALMNGLF